MRTPCLLIALASLVVSQIACAEAPPTAQSITIDARWRGLGDPIDEHFEIVATKDGYLLGPSRIDDRAVRRLVDALTAPPVPRDVALQTLTSAEWLRKNTGSAYRVLSEAQGECSAAARALFTTAFTNRETALRAARAHYDSFHFDDYPSMTVRARFADGTAVHAASGSQHALMLPWNTERGATWNPEISSAVASLLPANSTQRARLLEDRLEASLAWEIGQVIRDRWEDTEERCLYAAIVSKLEGHVTIDRVYHAWPGQFAAYLRVPGAPGNLSIDTHITADTIDGVERFLKRIPRYVEIARTFVKRRPETAFELWYHDGQSVTPDSLQLHEGSQPDDPNLMRVQAVSGEAVLLRDRDHPDQKWVVLPTGEIVDWHG